MDYPTTTAGPSSPLLQGGDVIIDWAAAEPNAPVNSVHTYAFVAFDKKVAEWAQAGKKAMLLGHYITYGGSSCTGGQALPSWEIAKLGSANTLCAASPNGGLAVIPNYFDQTFIDDLQTFVKAVADHYAASPYKSSIAYVRIGTGVGGEEFPVQPTYANVAQVTRWGYTPIVWRNWVEARLTNYHSVFGWTAVLNSVSQIPVGAGQCTPGAKWCPQAYDSGVDPTTGKTGLPIQAEIAYWAAAHGLGVGSQALLPKFTYAESNVIIPYVRQHWPGTFIEMQPTAAVTGLTQLQGEAQTAYCYGANLIEWYAQDASNPSYATTIRSWNGWAQGTAPPPNCTGY